MNYKLIKTLIFYILYLFFQLKKDKFLINATIICINKDINKNEL